jgi:DNA-binding transcriptional regulator WhiA
MIIGKMLEFLNNKKLITMPQITLDLPLPILNALTTYTQEQQTSSADTVQTALESFLIAKGYLTKPRKTFHLDPTSIGSGYNDTAINHDVVLNEFILSQKLNQTES